MSIKVLFFGSTAAITGKRQIEIEMSADTLARSILDQMLTEYPNLNDHRLLLSVNQQFATGDEILRNGDEIAIFTAVSGG